jgi:transposase-like protein
VTERAPNRQYSPEEVAEAVALSLAIGPMKAAEQLGLPVRTVSGWRSGEYRSEETAPVILQSRRQLADRMNEILSVASEQVLAGLRDPRQRLGDRVRALEVALEAARLLGAESQVGDALTDDEADQLTDWLRLHDAEIEAAERELAALGPGEASDA